jgi:hypothetical protein
MPLVAKNTTFKALHHYYTTRQYSIEEGAVHDIQMQQAFMGD